MATITKERIIDILNEHSFDSYDIGFVVSKSHFDAISDCILSDTITADDNEEGEIIGTVTYNPVTQELETKIYKTQEGGK